MNSRLYGIDLLRFLLVPPIIMFHIWNTIVGEVNVKFAPGTSLYLFYERVIGNTFGHAGIFIFCISFFLFGYKRDSLFKFKLRDGLKIALLTGAMISSQFNSAQNATNPEFFIWDIFSFIILSYFISSFLALIESRKVLMALLAFSGLLFLVPVETYAGWYGWPWSENLRSTFVATVTSLGPNGWFIWPWVGLPIGFYSLGRLYFIGLAPRIYIAPLAVGFLMFLVGPHAKPIAGGSQFYDFSFWQPPLVTISRLLLFGGALLWAAQTKWAQKFSYLSKLQWNRNFWICYILQIGLIDIASDYADFFSGNLWAFDWLWVFVLVAIEIMVQILNFYFLIFRWFIRAVTRRFIRP